MVVADGGDFRFVPEVPLETLPLKAYARASALSLASCSGSTGVVGVYTGGGDGIVFFGAIASDGATSVQEKTAPYHLRQFYVNVASTNFLCSSGRQWRSIVWFQAPQKSILFNDVVKRDMPVPLVV